MQIHNGSLENCAAGDQDSVDPLIEVANGGTVRNVIMGNNVGDGIHCLGSCTIENVWFPNVCDDAISIMGSGTVTIRNSGSRTLATRPSSTTGPRPSPSTTCTSRPRASSTARVVTAAAAARRRTATIQNVVAIGVDQVAGVSTNDRVTLRNICVHRTFSLCSIYDPGTSDEARYGVNGSNEGPSTNCIFTANDTHALLSRVTGIPFTTEKVCGGPNGYKSGSTATACVSGFDKCLKACMPGGYGFKEITCTNNRYAEGTGAICAMPTDSVAGAEPRAVPRDGRHRQRSPTTARARPQWAIGIDESNNAEYCALRLQARLLLN